MGIFARALVGEARRFATKAPAAAAQQFGRKLTHFAQARGSQVASAANQIADHAGLAGFDGVSKTARAVGQGAESVANIGRLLDANQPRAAVDRALSLIGKNY